MNEWRAGIKHSLTHSLKLLKTAYKTALAILFGMSLGNYFLKKIHV
jgi:hypothetical protein